MPYVLDASVASSWAFDDEDHPRAAAALRRTLRDAAHVPALWWYEVRNTLIVNERRGRFTEAISTSFLGSLASIVLFVDHSPDEAAVLGLARHHRLTVYDAAYLELAARRAIALATLDAALAEAAAAEGVPLVE